MDYTSIKLLHQSAVLISGLGFAVRGIASLRCAQWTRGRLAKTLPHVVDSILLLSAILLATELHLNPVDTPWLLAKVLGLLLYIGLGMIALRVRFAWQLRAVAWVAALMVFTWIASVAVLKNPWGFLRLVWGV